MPKSLLDPLSHGTEAFHFSIYPHSAENAFGRRLFFSPHWHPEYEMIYIRRGSPVFEISGMPYYPEENQVLFVNRYQVHSWPGNRTLDFSFDSILFGEQFLFPDTTSQIYAKYIHPPQGEIDLPTHLAGKTAWERKVSDIVRTILPITEEKRNGYELELQIRLLSVFSEIIQAGAYRYNSTLHDKNLSRIRDVLHYLNNNYSEEIRISDLAEEFHISLEHLIRTFRKATGKSPGKYLLDYRLHMAISKLIGSDEKISSIADSCGFSDMSYFSKAFRAYTGETPTTYRRIHRGGE